MAEPLRSLVVDAEEPSRAFLRELLGARGHTCAVASSLAEGRSALERGRFDLLVTDLLLPADRGRTPLVQNGYELVRGVRARSAREQAHVLVCASEGLTATDVALAFDHGCDVFVFKRDRERLVAKVAEAEVRLRSAAGGVGSNLPLEAESWEDCTIVLGQPTSARVGSGGEVVVEPTPRVEQVLYHLQFGEQGSDLLALASVKATRRSLARHAREFLRAVFRVRSGPSDPLPWQRAQGTWASRVRLRERDHERETRSYEELRRRGAASEEVAE
ncbi:MAG: response regulator [Vicinamibacteria bacterium]